MKTFQQNGKTIMVTNGSSTVPITGGTPVSVGGTFCGIAISTIPPLEAGPLETCGVHRLPTQANLAIAQGANVYWSVADGEVTTDATDVPLGKAWEATDGTAPDIAVNLEPKGAGTGVSGQAADAGVLTSTNLVPVATASGNTYSDAAINAVISALEARLDASDAKVNNYRTVLRAAGLMA
jgi:predicted RecA/RadA family phage recombinase